MDTDKEFEKWIKSNDIGSVMYHAWGYTEEEMELCWQESDRRATEMERKRIVDMLVERLSGITTYDTIAKTTIEMCISQIKFALK